MTEQAGDPRHEHSGMTEPAGDPRHEHSGMTDQQEIPTGGLIRVFTCRDKERTFADDKPERVCESERTERTNQSSYINTKAEVATTPLCAT